MNTSGVFLTGMLILLVFNAVYITMYPAAIITMGIGLVLGLCITVVPLIILAGVQVLGTGLNTFSLKILFGILVLINIMFQIPIKDFPIGLGLANNVFAVFPSTAMFGLGFLIATVLCIMTFISGILSITSGTTI